MKICMVSNANASNPYGSTIRPHYFAKNLSRDGFPILHICDKRPTDEEDIEHLSLDEHSGQSEDELFRMIQTRCEQFAPDVIYTHQVYTAKIALKLKSILNRPHVYDPHSSIVLESPLDAGQSISRIDWLIAAEKEMLKLTHKIVAPSPELKDYLNSKYGVPRRKISIVKNGVETDVFKPTPPDMDLRDSLGIPRASTLIVFTNPRVFPSNDIALRYFLELVPEIETKCRDAIFLILGGGAELETPSPRVIYTGFVENLPAYINLADVCVAPFPSNAICGGTRNKICEYLACGKTIVSTMEGMRGFDDAVHGEHFLLAEDSADFVSQLAYAITHPEKSARMGKNARTLSRKYDWRPLSRKLGGILIDEFNNKQNATHH